MGTWSDSSDLVVAAREQMLRRDAVIFGASGTPLHQGILDFPLPDKGVSYVWVGYWISLDAQRVGAPPLLTVATAFADGAEELRQRLGVGERVERRSTGASISFRGATNTAVVPLMSIRDGSTVAEFTDGDRFVVMVGSDSAVGDVAHVEPLAERVELVDSWLRVAAG